MVYSPSVGAKVKITPKLTEGDGFRIYVHPRMLKFKGKTATVTGIEGIYVYLDIAEGRWLWTADMLQPVTFQTKRRTYAT